MPRTPQEFFNSNLRWTGVQKLYSFYIQYTLDKTYCFRSALTCSAPMCPVPIPFPSVALSPSPIPCLFLVSFLFSLSLFPLFYFLSSCPIHPYSLSHSASFIACLPVLLLHYLFLTLFLFTLSLIQLLSLPACLPYYFFTCLPALFLYTLSLFQLFSLPACLPYFSIYCLLTLFSFILPACLSYYKTSLSLFPIPLFSVSL